MRDTDPTVLGLPCRFPAAALFRPESRVQNIDQKRLFITGRTSKKFYPEFPVAAGKGRGDPPLFRRFGAVAASSSAIAASFFLPRRPLPRRPQPAIQCALFVRTGDRLV